MPNVNGCRVGALKRNETSAKQSTVMRRKCHAFNAKPQNKTLTVNNLRNLEHQWLLCRGPQARCNVIKTNDRHVNRMQRLLRETAKKLNGEERLKKKSRQTSTAAVSGRRREMKKRQSKRLSCEEHATAAVRNRKEY